MRRIGLGENFDLARDQKIIDAFKCFSGCELRVLRATAFPQDRRALEIRDASGFCSQAGDRLENDMEDSLVKDLQPNPEGYKEWVDRLNRLYDPNENENPLELGELYTTIEIGSEKERTFRKTDKKPVVFHLELHLLPFNSLPLNPLPPWISS